MRWWRRKSFWWKAIPVVVLAAMIGKFGICHSMADWRTASRASAGIAPDPATHREAIVQVYGARAFGWRGYFGVHTWVAVKPTNAADFTVYEVIGWRVRRGAPAIYISNRPADGRWFDAMPEILADVRGEGVDEMIQRIDRAARTYRYKDEYRAWPGPNSNTFVAQIAREVPELKLDLPPTAIGKDYLLDGAVFSKTPSGTGYQFSLGGLLGLMIGREEGMELNILGLIFGIDPLGPAIKLPMAGRIGGT